MSAAASAADGAGRAERLRELLGDIDVYLLDQWMKGRLPAGSRILDAGCGGGRNLEPFLRCGYPVWAVDAAPRATLQTRRLGSELAAPRPCGWVSRQSLESLAFRAGAFDAVIACAVLHFAPHPGAWTRSVDELWRVLAPGGLLFVRLASSIGIEDRVEPLGDGRFVLPDGSTRFLVDRERLAETSARLGGLEVEPVKTTLVESLRAMTTWCLTKPAEDAV